MKPLLLALLLMTSASALTARVESFRVASPDGSLEIGVKITDRIYYNLSVDGKEVMWYSPVSMRTSQGHFGDNPELLSADTTHTKAAVETAWGNRKVVPDHYHQLELKFRGGYSLLFRAYDDGVAYRFRSDKGGELIVYDEEVEYRFWEDFGMINHIVEHYQTSYERYYTHQTISEVTPDTLVSLPSLVVQDDVKLGIMESDVFEYPGMYLTKVGTHNRNYLSGSFPRYPTAWERGNWGHFGLKVTARADFLARTEGNRVFPWRAIAVAREDIDLVDSDLVYKLARPSKIDTSWIRPGKVAWDWWNALNLVGVDFETGINNRTYEYFIDFAAENGIEYIIMDEGWSDQFDVLLPTPRVDMEHLTAYARKKGVGIILWGVWYTMDRQHEEAFALFEKWGIAGVKVDFIDRDDQLAIEFYERLAREAAEHRLLVDYHGCSKPTGLHRTYPNVINFEAVLGNEYNKFSEGTPPSHNVDVAFTRMAVGPLDYTPGAMENALEGDFRISFENPVSHGTRMHQLGMFVVYFSPLQMLCDDPTAYEAHPEILRFLSHVPVTWDETVPLAGAVGEYIVMARQKGDAWYIGGLTNWTGRSVDIDLSRFAAPGAYSAEMLVDGVNAHRAAGDYQFVEKSVSANDTLSVEMAPGGGFAIRLQRQ